MDYLPEEGHPNVKGRPGLQGWHRVEGEIDQGGGDKGGGKEEGGKLEKGLLFLPFVFFCSSRFAQNIRGCCCCCCECCLLDVVGNDKVFEWLVNTTYALESTRVRRG